MPTSAVETVFVDVGGTLWPNAIIWSSELRAEREARLATVLGVRLDISPSLSSMIETLEATPLLAPDEPRDAWVARVLADYGFELDRAKSRRARQAMCTPLADALQPLAHASSMLSGLKELGLKSIVVSNTSLLDAEHYRRDFTTAGWAEWVDDYVTSVEANCSKPDEKFFQLALDLAGSSPDRCVMVGNSESADIAPAAKLGMRTVLVAVEDPIPASSVADVIVTSLDEVAPIIRNWIAA